MQGRLPEILLDMSDSFLNPEKCAAYLTSYLDQHPNTNHIDFSGYGRNLVYNSYEKLPLKPIAIAIANRLKTGNYPAGLKINFHNKSCSKACAIAFAEALESGNCKLPLTINLMHVSLEGIKVLTKAIMSGKCPKNLYLDISGATIDVEEVQEIALALQHKNCPENLHISILFCGSNAAEILAEALQSGKCQRGLQIDLKDFGKKGVESLACAFKSGKLPPGFHFTFYGLTEQDTKTLTESIEMAFAERKLPVGFGVTLKPSTFTAIFPDKNLVSRIDNILKKNEAYHAAIACVTLQQGKRQNIFLQEVLNQIYPYLFFSCMKSFFKAEQKAIQTSPRCISYVYQIPFEKVKKEQTFFLNKLHTLFASSKLLESKPDDSSETSSLRPGNQ